MKRKHAFLLLLALVATPPLLVYGASDHSIPTQKQIHFVIPGEKLWDIASEERPGENTLKVVYEIEELNGIVDAGSLAVGTELKLP